MPPPGRFAPVERRPRLSDTVAEQLLASIVSRGMQPGDRLPTERELAEQFAVSRTVVREAVRALAGKGIIEARPGRGLTVSLVAADAVTESLRLYLHGSETIDYRKVHEVRTILEVQVASLAAERSTPVDIVLLEAACDRLDRVLADVAAASREDLEFHRLLAATTHNELFGVLLDAVGGPLREIRLEAFAVPGRTVIAAAAHRAILGRIRDGDPAGARMDMRAHLDDVEHLWEEIAKP